MNKLIVTLMALLLAAPVFFGFRPEEKTIVGVAVDAGFNTLVTAVKAADLATTLSGKGPFTVFAPTDEAFAKLPEGALAGLLKDIPALKNVLLYHVVSGTVLAKDVVKLKEAKTLQGGAAKVKVENGTVFIDNAKVTKTDVKASNGVIHVIDAVILPKK